VLPFHNSADGQLCRNMFIFASAQVARSFSCP
jgi:hypothetical protein